MGKYDTTKEWAAAKCPLEEGHEIGAGSERTASGLLDAATCSPVGWRSVAVWPKPAVNLMSHDNSSTDTHHSEEAARAVCGMLRRNGFGGDGKIFPLETRVEPIFPENAIGEARREKTPPQE